jgi:hypothetical protein
MIEKIYKNKYMAICDNCGTGQECDSWADVMDFMNEEGWKKKLFDGEWKHFCPECITTTLHSKKEMIVINEQTTTKVEYPNNFEWRNIK